MPSNAYSRRWHETFSRARDGSEDVAFLAEWLPPGFDHELFTPEGGGPTVELMAFRARA